MVVCIAYDIQYEIWKLVDANSNDLTYFQTQLALISSAELEKLLQLQLFCKPCFNFSSHWKFSKVYFQTFELCRYKSHCWKQNSRRGDFLTGSTWKSFRWKNVTCHSLIFFNHYIRIQNNTLFSWTRNWCGNWQLSHKPDLFGVQTLGVSILIAYWGEQLWSNGQTSPYWF